MMTFTKSGLFTSDPGASGSKTIFTGGQMIATKSISMFPEAYD